MSATALTDRKRDELHKAIIDYLRTAGFPKTADQFKEEAAPVCAIPEGEDDARSKDILVKKWTSVIRLQKKIMDLESRLAHALKENTEMASGMPSSSQRTDNSWIPSSGFPKQVLTSHRDKVNAVTFHPLYSVLVSASDDCTLKVWDWDTGTLERTIQGHTRRVTDCDFDSKGNQLVSASHDLFVKLWAVDKDYQNFATLRGHDHSVSAARFLPGDDRVVSASRDTTIRIWEIATTHCIRVIRTHSDWIRGAVPSLDGNYLATACSNHTAQVIDLATGKLKIELRGHENVVETAVFVPPHCAPSIAELILNKTGSPAPALTVPPEVAFVITTSRDQKLKLWDTVGGACLHTFVGHDGWVNGVTFHPSGQYVLSAADDGSIRVWDIKTGRCSRKLDTSDRFVSSIAWSRQTAGSNASTNGKEVPRLMNVFASGCWDHTINVWMP